MQHPGSILVEEQLLSDGNTFLRRYTRPLTVVLRYADFCENFGPLTRLMPAARSGVNRPESAASYARRLTAASLPLIVPGTS